MNKTRQYPGSVKEPQDLWPDKGQKRAVKKNSK